MIRTLLCLALACASVFSPARSASARDAAQDEREILRTEALICKAFESGDGATLEKHLDARFTLTSSRGEVTDRKQNIAEVVSREPRYEVFRNHEQKLRLYGDAAIETGITTIKAIAGGKPFAADFQFTDTYVYRDGHWLLAASHASRRRE